MTVTTKRFISSRKSCSCSMPGVWRAVAYMTGAVVIFHSPRACAHIARTMDINSHYRTMAESMREDLPTVPLLSSQLEEKHSIFGGGDRLDRCIDFAVKEYKPELLVIACSCLAGVIGDDVLAVAADAERKYGIPVLASESCGFLDGEYYQGYFEIASKLMDRYFKPQEKEPGTALLVGDNGGPWGTYARETTRMLEAMGVKVLGQFPGYVPVKDLPSLTRAETAVILGGRGYTRKEMTELGNRFADEYGMKVMQEEFPVGWSHTLLWIGAMGRLLGKEKEAALVRQQEEERFAKAVEKYRTVTEGKKTVVCIARLLMYFHPAAVMETIRNLGLDLTGVVFLDVYDEKSRKEMEDAVRSLTDAPFYNASEADGLLKEADVVLTTHELANRSLRQIFLPMLPLVGAAGETRFMETIYRVLKSKICRGGVIYV